MAYTEDKEPSGLTVLTSLATDDTFIVGDTSDTIEDVKTITKANLITDLGIDTKAPIDNPTFTTRINTPVARATTSAGMLVEAANGTDVADFGIGNTANSTFYGAVQVPDDVYDASGWNGNTTVPTKNAIRDKIESLVLGSGGITRSVTVTSGSVTAGSSANTDYVYMVAGAHTISLPAASGNTNLYVVKNNHSANITVDTAGAETIEGSASISVAPEESVFILSNGTNYFIV